MRNFYFDSSPSYRARGLLSQINVKKYHLTPNQYRTLAKSSNAEEK